MNCHATESFLDDLHPGVCWYRRYCWKFCQIQHVLQRYESDEKP